jgi:hypothetical protein
LTGLGFGGTMLAKEAQGRGRGILDLLLLLINDASLQDDFRLAAAKLAEGGRCRRPHLFRRVVLQNVDERRDAPGITKLPKFSRSVAPAGRMVTLQLLRGQYHRVERIRLGGRPLWAAGGAPWPGGASSSHAHSHTWSTTATAPRRKPTATSEEGDSDDRRRRDA